MYILKGGPPNEYWDRINNGLYSGDFTIVRDVIEFNGDVFIGTNSGVYKRTSSGWIEKNVGLTNTNVTALGGSGSFLFAGTNTSSTEGVFISSDHGESWSFLLTIPWVTSIQAIGPNIFASSYGDGIWLSIDYGSSWTQINDGFSSSAYYVLSTGINDKYIYAGTNASGVWRRELTELITDVNSGNNLTPSEFYLEQNYPNPFNPSTSIQYQVSSISQVTLKVYDILGNEIVTLVNEEKPAGIYEIAFYATGLSSGIYFYKLSAGSFVQTRKMLLVK
ncbi:MAG: T9SS type A sorting domain-containing protein [Ignavibacteriaceae bacterium]|nr:T9SS type A sorting domain-containing protein [Ignavibacteriaceae bacterium]